MSRSQRRIVTHLKNNGFLVDAEHEATLKEWNITTEEFRNKSNSDKRRIIGMLYDFGYQPLAEYLKTIK